MIKNKSKRLLSLLLTLVMIFTLTAIPMFAADDTSSESEASETGETSSASVVTYSEPDAVEAEGVEDEVEVEEYVDYGIATIADDDETGTETAATTVATVDGVGYSTLSAAITAASTNGTVTLADNVELDTPVTVSGTMTLDLNGKTITRASGNEYTALIQVASGGTLTIQDTSSDESGYIYSANYSVTSEDGSTSTKAGYGILSYGTVTITSGTVKGYYGVRVAGGDLNVLGGTVTGSYIGISIATAATSSTVTISKGNVTGKYGIVQFGGKISVTGGSITGTDYYGIQVGASLTVDGTDAIISGNSIGVYCNGGTTEIKSGTVSGFYYGAYVAGTSADLTVSGSAVVKSTCASAEEDDYSATAAIVIYNGAKVTINDGTVTGGYCGVAVWGGESANNPSTLIVNGGSISAFGLGVSTNGSQYYTSITINDGTIYGGGTGMYLPAMESSTVINGGTITGGATGIEIRAGSLTVNGGTITGEGNPGAYSEDGNASGTTTVGAAIAVVQHTTRQTITVTITEKEGTTTISGYYGIFEADLQSNGNEYTKNVSITVEAGTVTTTSEDEDSVAIYHDSTSAATVSVFGGTYSSDVSEYTVDNTTTVTNDDGTVTVVSGTYIAAIGTTYYEELSEAFSAVKTGETIKLLGDESITGAAYNGDGYYQVSNKVVTLDLGGYTLSVDTTRILGVKNGGTLNVENGTIAIADDTGSTYKQFNMVRGSSTFTATNVVFDANEIGTYAVYIASDSSTTATVELTDCTFTDVTNAIVFDAGNTSTVTLTGCSYAKQPFSTSTFNTVDNYTVVITKNSLSTDSYEANNSYSLFFNYVVEDGGTIETESTVTVKSYYGDASLTINDGGTVKANVRVNDDTSMTVNGGTVTGTITVAANGSTEENAILTASAEEYDITGGLLTITGGTITGQVKSSGTLIMTGGTVKDDGTGYSDGVIYILNGNVYVSGGTVTGTKRGIGFAGSGTISGTISGGSITGNDIALMVRANTSNNVKVRGGSFTATNALYLANESETSTIFAEGYSAYNTSGSKISSTASGSVTLYKSSLADKTVVIAPTSIILGGSSSEETSVTADSITGIGTNTLYAGVSDVSSSYSTTNYPTTSLTYTDVDGETHGYIFAGWYEDSTGTTVCTSIPSGTAYAKFVDANALRVICVYTPGSLSATGNDALRFLSSMDSLEFLSFKFVVNGTPYACTGYAMSCTVSNSSMYRTFTKADISSASHYLMTYRIYEEGSLADTYSVYACWETADGTVVSGETLTITSSSLTGAMVLGE